MVTVRIDRGVVRVGDAVEIVGLGADREVVVTGTQAFHRDVPCAEAGMNVGLLLRGVRRNEVRRGQLLVTPRSLVLHSPGDTTRS